MKRILMLFLSVLLLAALAVTANATEQEEPTRKNAIIQEARRVYEYSRSTAGKSSFAGFCGLMTSHQLYHMGINETIIVNDGNRQYDYYAARKVTTGGYYITCYPATDYTLEEALNAITKNGKRDAYNLLVGFQWTNTQAGGRYGHACVINAIVDGTVYFTESFYTSIAGREGNVGQCSIEKFAWLFDDWTSFEGVIDFGTGQYADACDRYDTAMYVRTRFDTTLRSQPCLLGEKDSHAIRQVKAGELLWVDAVCKDYDTGMAYYRVEEEEGTGYISAGAASLVQASTQSLTLKNVAMDAYLKPNKPLTLSGRVVAGSAAIGELEVMIINAEGKVLVHEKIRAEGHSKNLSLLNGQLAKWKPKSGWYRVQIYASAACKYVVGTDVETAYARQKLHEQVLQVSKTPQNTRAPIHVAQEEKSLDGWISRGEKLYRYDQNEMKTGWYEELGVRYYLQEDGTAATGWQEIDGVRWYFSSTGALCQGWLTTAEGVVYLKQEGGQASGWQTIEKEKYYFNKDSVLVTEGVVKDGKKRYEIQADGKATLLKDKK